MPISHGIKFLTNMSQVMLIVLEISFSDKLSRLLYIQKHASFRSDISKVEIR